MRAALDGERAAALRPLVADMLVVEDDHLGPVAGTPYHSIAGARWATVRSVSKWLGPDLRLAVVTGDEATLARVEGRQSLGPGWVSGLTQQLAVKLWDDPAVARAAAAYRERREALAALLDAAPARAASTSGCPCRTRTPPSARCSPAATPSPPGRRTGSTTGPAIRITTSTVTPDEAPRLAAAVEAAITPPRRTRAA